MTEFVIGNSNFGVDANKSSFKLLDKPNGRVLVDIEINGDQSTYNALSEAEDFEWSWTIYPPRFYLYVELDVAVDNQNLTVRLSESDLDSAESAIYMMNHNQIDDVTLKIHGDHLTVTGNVDVMGQPAKFRINWSQRPSN